MGRSRARSSDHTQDGISISSPTKNRENSVAKSTKRTSGVVDPNGINLEFGTDRNSKLKRTTTQQYNNNK